jgi:hypothetical protein
MLDTRDFVAAVVAAVLVFVALSLATALHFFRRGRERAREAERMAGRTIIAELPTADQLQLFTEDPTHFHYGSQPIDKRTITAVRVLINGAPIATVISRSHPSAENAHPTSFDDRPEGIARDRWDVAIETLDGTVLVECGAIRERVSQELARAVFDAVRRAIA